MDPDELQQALAGTMQGQPPGVDPKRLALLGLIGALSGNKQLAQGGEAVTGYAQHAQQIDAMGQRYNLDRQIKAANEQRQETRDQADAQFKTKQLGVLDSQRRDISADRLASAQALRDTQLQTKNDQFNEREVNALAKQDQKATAALAAHNAANNLLSRMQEDPSVPGIGRIQGKVPTMLQPDSWQVNNADATELAKSVLLMKGGQISPEALRQQQKALGLASGSDVNTFKNGLRTALTEVADKLAQREAGFKPENVGEYRKRGGLTSQDVRATIEKLGGGGAQASAATDALRKKYGL